jgi:hypothetical protein
LDNQPPIGVGLDLSQIVARDAELQEGASWQELVPGHRESTAV